MTCYCECVSSSFWCNCEFVSPILVAAVSASRSPSVVVIASLSRQFQLLLRVCIALRVLLLLRDCLAEFSSVVASFSRLIYLNCYFEILSHRVKLFQL